MLASARRLPGGIPKIIHRIWLGSQMSDDAVAFGERWRSLHPLWTVVDWRDWSLPALRNQAAFDRPQPASGRANIARYELLERFGGVYVDTDVEPLRPLDDILGPVRCALAREDADWVATAFIASALGHGFLSKLCDDVGRSVLAAPEGTPTPFISGPRFLTRELAEWDGRDAVAVFPPELFYPYHYSEPHRRGERFDGAYAVHHWAHSWLGGSIGPSTQKDRREGAGRGH